MTIGAGKFANLLGGNGVAARYQQREAMSRSKNYVGFVQLLYADLDDIINTFQANPQKRNQDGEDRITEELVSNLGTAGYDASHDTASGGHVDLTVKLGRHSWIGEAKKDAKFDEGFKQLSDRYRPASGNFHHNHGGMLLYYCKGADVTTQLDRWRKKLPTVTYKNGIKFKKLETIDCPTSEFSFFSRHMHNVTGKYFIVRHMAVGLQFEPSDASGRNVRAKAAKRISKAKTIKHKR